MAKRRVPTKRVATARAPVGQQPRRDTTQCSPGVCNPERTQGLRAPAPNGTHDLVTLQGPGVFLGAAVSKQGGTNDLTFVIIDIDGRNVTNLSYAAAINQGLTQQNPYGLVLVHSDVVKTFTVGFPAPLLYRESLRVRVTVNEPNVVQILANVVHGSV